MSTNQAVLWEEVWKRTPNTKTYHLADGSKQAVIFMGQAHYEDESGHYQNIDTALHDEADFDSWDFPVNKHGKMDYNKARGLAIAAKKANSLNRDLFDFQALKVPFFAKIPRVIKRGYTIGKGADKVTFKPVNCSPSKGYVRDDDNNKIDYQDAWNDTDVSLQITDKGIKETLMLKTSKAPTAFSFEVIGALGSELALQPAWLEDANGVKRDVPQTFRIEADKTFLDLVADVTGLVYPIVIDPTVTIQPDATVGVDTYVTEAYLNNSYETATLIYAGTGTSSLKYRSLIKFDVSGISGTILSAYITLVCGGEYSSTDYDVSVHRVTGEWAENITWNTQPTYDPVAMDTVTITATALPYMWDVSNFYQGVIDDSFSDNGLCLIGNETISGTFKGFRSSDYTANVSQRPKLTITYNELPSAPVLTVPNGGETWNAEHTATWTASTDLGAEETAISVVGGSGTLFNAGIKKGQTFTTTTPDFITAVEIMPSCSSGQVSVPFKIVGTTGGLPDMSNVYFSTDIVVPVTAVSQKITVDPLFSVPSGTMLAWVVENTSAYQLRLEYNGADVYTSGGWVSYDGSTWTTGSADTYFKVYTNQSTPQASLQYQIQLSTDNGLNYHDIVALTAAGATSYVYDFTPEAQSSTCLIRVRAYDGVSYGPWDTSDGVFTILHNQAPTAPTNLSPSSGVIDRALVNRLSWQHNDPDSDPQAKFDLMYSVNAGSTWTTITQTTTNQYWDAPGGTFAHGNVLWKVRTYDQAGLSSAYSSQATFLAGDKADTPTVTAPTGTVVIPSPTIQWSSFGQAGYQINVVDALDAVTWDSGDVTSTNKAQTVGVALTNGEIFTVKVRIRNAEGLWSDWGTSTITMSYTPPATPTIEVIEGTGYIGIAVTNPTPTGTEPTVTGNDIYRRKQGESAWERIATDVLGGYSDYAVASGQVYEYKAKAIGDSGAIAESTVGSQSITFEGVWLHDVSDPVVTVHNFVWDGSGRSLDWAPEAAMMQFAGRKSASVEFGEAEEESISAQLQMLRDSEDYAKLDALIKLKSTLCFRDGRGRKMFGVVLSLPWKDNTFGNNITVQINKTSYEEAV